jgi:hypothetical protein
MNDFSVRLAVVTSDPVAAGGADRADDGAAEGRDDATSRRLCARIAPAQ